MPVLASAGPLHLSGPAMVIVPFRIERELGKRRLGGDFATDESAATVYMALL
jgi:hypothetical protein